MLQYKSVQMEYKVDEAKREIEAYVSVFNHIDAYKDRVVPGAFSKTIREDRTRKSSRIKALMHHDSRQLVGKPMHIEEDSTGLLTVTKVSKTARGDELLVLAQDEVITETSIGYNAIQEKWDHETSIRDLIEVRLWEYSFVTWGANDMALVQGVKSIGELWNMLDVIAETEKAIKSGKPLSPRDLELAKKAYEALGTLLKTAEPSSDTQQGQGAVQNPKEPGNHSAGDQGQKDDIKALAESILLESKLHAILKEVK